MARPDKVFREFCFGPLKPIRKRRPGDIELVREFREVNLARGLIIPLLGLSSSCIEERVQLIGFQQSRSVRNRWLVFITIAEAYHRPSFNKAKFPPMGACSPVILLANVCERATLLSQLLFQAKLYSSKRE